MIKMLQIVIYIGMIYNKVNMLFIVTLTLEKIIIKHNQKNNLEAGHEKKGFF